MFIELCLVVDLIDLVMVYVGWCVCIVVNLFVVFGYSSFDWWKNYVFVN